MEDWLPVPDYEGFYEVSNLGCVRSCDRVVKNYRARTGVCVRRGSIMRLNNGRYKSVMLCRDGVERTHLVHRLVALAFVKGDHSLTVDHINKDKHDNRADNLRWIPHSENARLGTVDQVVATGVNSTLSKLTAEQVRAIREDGRTCLAIGSDYNVSAATVSLVKRRLRYPEVS